MHMFDEVFLVKWILYMYTHTDTHVNIYICTVWWLIKYLEQLMYVPIVGTVVRVLYLQWEHTQAVPNI